MMAAIVKKTLFPIVILFSINCQCMDKSDQAAEEQTAPIEEAAAQAHAIIADENANPAIREPLLALKHLIESHKNTFEEYYRNRGIEFAKYETSYLRALAQEDKQAILKMKAAMHTVDLTVAQALANEINMPADTIAAKRAFQLFKIYIEVKKNMLLAIDPLELYLDAIAPLIASKNESYNALLNQIKKALIASKSEMSIHPRAISDKNTGDKSIMDFDDAFKGVRFIAAFEAQRKSCIQIYNAMLSAPTWQAAAAMSQQAE